MLMFPSPLDTTLWMTIRFSGLKCVERRRHLLLVDFLFYCCEMNPAIASALDGNLFKCWFRAIIQNESRLGVRSQLSSLGEMSWLFMVSDWRSVCCAYHSSRSLGRFIGDKNESSLDPVEASEPHWDAQLKPARLLKGNDLVDKRQTSAFHFAIYVPKLNVPLYGHEGKRRFEIEKAVTT